MLLLAKFALGCGATLVLAGAYTCREGLLGVQVDERHPGGSHVHVWLPAAVVPMAMHFVPRRQLERAAHQAGPWMPTLRALTRELRTYPDAELVDVRDARETVHIRTRHGKLLVDVQSPEETVHIACPLAMIEDVASALQAKAPAV